MVKKVKGKPRKNTKKVPDKSGNIEGKEPDKISFDYIKSNYFRVIRADGVHGGVTPKINTIQMALFSERQPIPRRETFKIEKGQLGKRIDMEKRDAVIREVEVEVIMDIQTARSISEWLQQKIESAEKMSKAK